MGEGKAHEESAAHNVIGRFLAVASLSGLCGGAVFSCQGTRETSQPIASIQAAIVNPATPTSAPVVVYRWWQPSDQDWVNIPAGGQQPSDTSLIQANYTKDAVPQFEAYLVGTQDMVAVYRWWQPSDKDWITIRDGSPSDSDMTNAGYVSKTFQFYAFPTQRAGTVPVYRWWQPADRDWITVADGEVTDSSMTAAGYIWKTDEGFYVFPAYAPGTHLPTPGQGYFPLSGADSPPTMQEDQPWEQTYGAGSVGACPTVGAPHTLSVVETPNVSIAGNGPHKYWGYYGLQGSGDIGLAYSDDLTHWSKALVNGASNPLFADKGQFFYTGFRWPSVVYDNGTFYMVNTMNYQDPNQRFLVLRISFDGTFHDLRNLSDPGQVVVTGPYYQANQNPNLFKDPVSGNYYLYWLQYNTNPSVLTQIMAASASTPQELVSLHLGQSGGAQPSVLASIPFTTTNPVGFGAPNMMSQFGTYYLTIETAEGDPGGSCPDKKLKWMTRVLVGNAPAGSFIEIPGNPILNNNSACFFQHAFADLAPMMHAYSCELSSWGSGGTWTIGHRTANMSVNPWP